MVNYLMTLGWSPRATTEIVPWADIEDEFRLEDVNHSPAFFDLKKLAAFNGEYIRMMTVDEFVAACEPWLPAEWDRDAVRAPMAPHIQSGCVTLAERRRWSTSCSSTTRDRRGGVGQGDSHRVAAAVARATSIAAYETCDVGCRDAEGGARERRGPYEIKLGKAQAPVRVAVTGRTSARRCSNRSRCSGRDEYAAPAAAATVRRTS